MYPPACTHQWAIHPGQMLMDRENAAPDSIGQRGIPVGGGSKDDCGTVSVPTDGFADSAATAASVLALEILSLNKPLISSLESNIKFRSARSTGAETFLNTGSPRSLSPNGFGEKKRGNPIVIPSDKFVTIWFPAANSTDTFGMDALINFINTLEPNRSSASHNKAPVVFWPKWKTPSSNGSMSLLTFSDPGLVNATAEDFRVEAMKFLFSLILNEAKKQG
ncbi:hypothetical protein DFH09DRAFT_1390803 [Mycena vulgaris]|nr:hypothetical protein DFH09DRAFT_1390803 [Mycena vulgaris]